MIFCAFKYKCAGSRALFWSQPHLEYSDVHRHNLCRTEAGDNVYAGKNTARSRMHIIRDLPVQYPDLSPRREEASGDERGRAWSISSCCWTWIVLARLVPQVHTKAGSREGNRLENSNGESMSARVAVLWGGRRQRQQRSGTIVKVLGVAEGNVNSDVDPGWRRSWRGLWATSPAQGEHRDRPQRHALQPQYLCMCFIFLFLRTSRGC